MTHLATPSIKTHIRNLTRVLALTVLSALTPMSANAQSMEYVIFSIKGEIDGLSLGQVLMEGDKFNIPAGTSVKLLGKDGTIQAVKGPQSGTVTNETENQKGEAALQRVSNQLFDNEQFVSVLGGTRTVGENQDIDTLFSKEDVVDPWLPKLSQLDVYCMKANRPLLDMGKFDAATHITLISDSSVELISVSLSQGRILNLNEYLSTTANKVVLRIKGRPMPITINLMSNDGISTLEQAAWLADNGCKQQSLRLLARS